MKIFSTLPRSSTIGGLAVFAALGWAGVPSQAGEWDNCQTIWSVPYVVNASGNYCVQQTLAVSLAAGAAIEVRADDVAIDLRGFTIQNTAGTDTRAVGVYGLSRKGVIIRNGTIRGFRYGVLLADSAGRSQGHAIERLRVLDSTAAGISVTGVNSLIWGNRVNRTTSAGPYAVGISQAGSGTYVLSNTVNNTLAGELGGYAAAIDLTHGVRRVANGNSITTVRGGSLNFGIRCGKEYAAENTVVGASTRFSLCTASAEPAPYPYPYPYPYPFSLIEEPYPAY
jgi:hypothetical protein